LESLKRRNQMKKWIMDSLMIVTLVVVPTLMVMFLGTLGCAQNSEPQGRMIQSNRGPNTPQDQRIVYNIIAGDQYNCPTSQPAGDTDADAAGQAETAMWARANPATGLASVQGPRRGRNHNVSIWTDASSAASPNVGSMNPSGSQSVPVNAEQSPRTQVNPALALAAPGGAASAAANGTAGFGEGTTTGGTTTATPTQTPIYTAVTAPANQMANILQSLTDWIRQLGANAAATATQPSG
jgi:hypothetical protein